MSSSESSDSDNFISEGSSDEILSDSEDQKDSEEEKAVQEAPAPEPEQPIPEQASPEESDQRFIRELEFVQSLANPLYLHDLAKRNFFRAPAFIKYLDYLQYWTTPEYAKFVRYPQAFYFLKLLQDENFRTFISVYENADMIQDQQQRHWRCYMKNRLDLTLPDVEVKE